MVDLLVVAGNERMHRWRQNELSIYGRLNEMPRKAVTKLIYQLVDAGLLERTAGDRPVLKLNAASCEVMRGKRAVTRWGRRSPGAERTAMEADTWEGSMRRCTKACAVRRDIAAERGVAAFVILHDSTLRELARLKPTTVEALRNSAALANESSPTSAPA